MSVPVVVGLVLIGSADRRSVLKGIAYYLMVLAVTMVPFALQRAFENPDVPIRMGQFSVERALGIHEWYGLLPRRTAVFLLAIVAGGYLFIVKDRLGRAWTEKLRGLLLVCLLFGMSVFSANVAILLYGKVTQYHHFTNRSYWMLTLVVMVFLLHGLSFVAQRYSAMGRRSARQEPSATDSPDTVPPPAMGRRYLRTAAGLSTLALLGLALTLSIVSIVMAFSVHPRYFVRVAQPAQPHVPRYLQRFNEYSTASRDFIRLYDHRDLSDLVAELQSPKYQDAVVLGTFTSPVMFWWNYYKGGYSYLAEANQSTVSDAEIEDRLMQFSRTIGMTEGDFLSFLRSHVWAWGWWVGAFKYQVTSIHALGPLSDYEEETQDLIVRKAGPFSMFFSIGSSEQRRLVGKFRNATEAVHRLDVVVLENTNNRPYWNDEASVGAAWRFGPAQEEFYLSFRNPTFSVWKRRSADSRRQ